MPYDDTFGVPSVAIGGIDLNNIQQVVACGVSSVAVVRAVTEASDLATVIELLQSHFPNVQRNETEVEHVV